jgi:hypothetical protein
MIVERRLQPLSRRRTRQAGYIMQRRNSSMMSTQMSSYAVRIRGLQRRIRMPSGTYV